MDADNENRRDEEAPSAPRTEGVRIIGADEAAAALEAGAAAGRRPEDAPRYGDVPEPPPASEPPAARFPLPNAVDPTQVVRPPVAGSTPEMQHWTEPPTGEVPAVLSSGAPREEDDDMAAWSGFAGGARWRDHPRDWDDADLESDLGQGLGAAAEAGPEPEDLFAPDEPLVPAEGVAPAPVGAARKLRTRISSRPLASRSREGRGGGSARYDDDWAEEEEELFSEQTLHSPVDPAPEAPRRGPRGPARSRPRSGAAALGTRLASGLGIGLLVLAVAQAGTLPLLALSALAAVLATAEGFAALRRAHYRPATLLGLVATVSVMLGAYLRGETALPLIAVLVVVFSLLWYLAGVVQARPTANLGATVAMFMWVGFLASYAGLLLDPTQFPHRHGVAFMMAAVVATVGYDVGGFAVGSRIGRRPLAPNISPNKTWEGLIGGMVTCLVVSAVIVSQVSPWDFKRAIALGVVAAIAAPLGDLCQSMIKRDLALKDMGSILPGHGGLLDRIDALLFVLPATYYLVRVLGIG